MSGRSSCLVSDEPTNNWIPIYWWEDVHVAHEHSVTLQATIIRDGYIEPDASSMSLLIPDRNKQNQEDFIWALPIDRVKWNKWYELSVKLRTTTPEKVRYVKRKEGEQVVTVLIMPNEQQTDDDAMVACAWLRMVQGISCRMYVVRSSDQSTKMNAAQLMNAVMGLDPDTIHEIEDPEETPDAKANP